MDEGKRTCNDPSHKLPYSSFLKTGIFCLYQVPLMGSDKVPYRVFNQSSLKGCNEKSDPSTKILEDTRFINHGLASIGLGFRVSGLVVCFLCHIYTIHTLIARIGFCGQLL